MRWTMYLILLLGISLPASAGFMDNILNKAKKITEDTVNSTVNTLSGSKPDQEEKSSQSATKSSKSSANNQFTNPKELGRQTFLATIHYHPEVLNDDKWLKRAAHTLYPKEAQSFNNNEFAWQKNKVDIKSRALKEAENPLLTIRLSPWTNPIGGRFVLGKYDFSRNSFRIKASKIQPSGFGDMRPYWEKLSKSISQIGWLAVSPEIAEKLVKSKEFSSKRTLYADYEYTITGAKKYNSKGETGLVSVINLKEVKLYHLNKAYAVNGTEDFEYIATLALPDSMAQMTEPVPAKKKVSEPIVKIPSPSKQTNSVKQMPQKPPKKADPLLGLGPYVRVEKGKPYGPDIVGLKLGMTLEEADAIIREYKGPSDVIIGKAPGPFIQVKGYVFEPGDESLTLLTLNSPSGERIAGYVRYMYFDPDNAPSQVAVVSSVEKKYGQASYVYEVKGSFERRWLSDALGNKVKTDQYGVAKGVRKCERAASLATDVNVFSGQKKGNAYLWYLPWLKERPAGSFYFLKPGNSKSIEQPNRCGPTLTSKYNDGSGTLIGATLSIALFDGAWIVEAVKKQNSNDAKQGAKGLKL